MESGRERGLGARIGPSPELEAIWGPAAPPTEPSPVALAEPDEPWPAPVRLRGTVTDAVVPRSPARARAVPVRAVVIGMAVAVLLAAAAAGAVTLRRSGDNARVAATKAEGAPPELPESSFDANAFLERFAAAATPTTTVPSTPTTVETFTATPTPAPAPPIAIDDPRLRQAEQAARDFVAAMTKRDCNALFSLLSARTLRFFQGEESKDSFCASLREEAIPTITVHLPARPYGRDGAVLTLEADGDEEDLVLVVENGRWVVDLLAAIDPAGDSETFADEDDDYADDERYESDDGGAGAKSDVRNALTAERVWFTDNEAYTDDLGALEDIEPSIVWRHGMAPAGQARPGEVYVTVTDGGRVVCLSARASDGTGYLVKDIAGQGPTYASGAIPMTCDSRPLTTNW